MNGHTAPDALGQGQPLHDRKRQRLAGPAGPAQPHTGPSIDHVEEAEASLLQLEVCQRLGDLSPGGQQSVAAETPAPCAQPRRACAAGAIAGPSQDLTQSMCWPQVEELLTELRLSRAQQAAVEELVASIAEFVQALPSAPVKPARTQGFLEDLQFSLVVRACVRAHCSQPAALAAAAAPERRPGCPLQYCLALPRTLPMRLRPACPPPDLLSSGCCYLTQKPFIFRPPTSVRAVGGFAWQAAALPRPQVDLAVTLPKECFDAKDQLNHR